MGLDANYGHVQPDGNYHYHGLPTGLMKRLGHKVGEHSPLIGWAADGFPIYALYGQANADDPQSEVVELTSSFALKKRSRSGGKKAPGEPGGMPGRGGPPQGPPPGGRPPRPF